MQDRRVLNPSRHPGRPWPRRWPRSRPLVLLVSLLLSGACAAVGPEPSEPSGPTAPPVTGAPESARGTLRVGIGRDPVSLDPRSVVDDEGEQVVRALFEGLVDIAPDGSVMAAGASSWSVEDGGRTLRFRLRTGTFHDGTPVGAADHARAILAVFDPDRAPFFRDDLLNGLLGAVVPDVTSDGSATSERIAPGEASSGERGAGGDAAARAPSTSLRRRATPDELVAAGAVEVVAPDELVLRLAMPDPRLLYELTDVALFPVPRRAELDPVAFALQPIGNGPFRMAGPREPGAFIRLAAVSDHHRAPHIDALVFQVYAADGDRGQRWDALVTGRLQVAAIPAVRRSEAASRFGSAMMATHGPGLIDAPTGSVYAYGFDVTTPPYDDVRLRRAVSLAVDRARLVADVLGGSADAATALVPPLLGTGEGICDHCRYDPTAARALLEDWATQRGVDVARTTLTLTYPRGPGHVGVAEQLARDLETGLGVRVLLQSRALDVFTRDVAAGEARLFRLGLRPALGGDAILTSLLDPTFRSDADRTRNPTGGGDLRRDALLDALRIAPDGEQAAILARDIERAVLDDVLVVPLFWTRHDLVVVPGVEGFRLDPTGRWWPELVSLR
jgi:oligopeptide transport system substrate-binding protein